MEIPIQTFIEMCQWDTSRFLIFSDNVFGTLIYYSHFLALILSLTIGILILLKDRKSLINQLLFLITLAFSFWAIFDLFLWANEKPDLQMFVWSAIIFVEPLIYILGFYFINVFINKKDISLNKKFVIFLPLLPIIILLPTKFVLQGFDLTNCYRDITEGFIATYYVYAMEIIYVLWILVYAIKKYRQSLPEMKKQIILITAGVVLFLLSFVSGNIIGSSTDNWTLAQVGLFSMPIFVIFLAYMIVKFKTFNIKVISTQILVFALGFLVLSVLFIRRIEDVRLVVIFTLFFVIVLGYILIRSVKKEVKQKEELAELNINLQRVIAQRESLMHLINHKVKGSFTHSKYIFAGLLDGMFGEISPEVKKIAQTGLDSDTMGIMTIDLILNAANLQSGTIKYDMKPIDFKEVVGKTIEDKKISITEKGLELITEFKDEKDMINGDIFWLKEVSNNLLENAIRYTEKGKIIIGLEKKDNKILFYVKDTGVGITPEDKKNLFTEGGRGRESTKFNVDSTGYGLYSVKLIVEAHKGRVWVESDGKDKGSQFFVEFDAI